MSSLSLVLVFVLGWTSDGTQSHDGAPSCAALAGQLNTAPLEREREEAAVELGSFREEACCAVAALLGAIEHDDSYIVPRAALLSLQRLGPTATCAVDRLILIQTPKKRAPEPVDPWILEETLAELGPAVIPRLIFHLRMSAPTLDDDAYQTAGLAERALRRFGKDAVPALIEVLFDPARSNSAVNALGSIGPAASDAAPALVRLYRKGTGDPEMAGPHSYTILRAFEAMKDKACVARDLMQEILRSPDTSPGTRQAAQNVLANLQHCPQ